jgi:hypothetical protein
MHAAQIAIITMVLVSISPFAARRLLLAAIAFFVFSAVCLADPLFMTRQYAARFSRSHRLPALEAVPARSSLSPVAAEDLTRPLFTPISEAALQLELGSSTPGRLTDATMMLNFDFRINDIAPIR